MDLCLIIDSSGSIRDNNPSDGSDNWTTQLEFLSNLVGAFSVGPDATRVAAVVFSETVELVFSLDRYDDVRRVQEAIENIAYMGQTTNTPEALIQARNQCFNPATGDRPNVLNLAIIVTDGVPFPASRRTPAIDAASQLRNAGITMVAIGVTNNIDVEFLKAMSSEPQEEGENYFTAIDFRELNTIRNTVVENTCQSLVPGMS